MYWVEGIKYKHYEYAQIIAERFYNRYNKSKTIEVIDDFGCVVHRLEAINTPPVECPNTIDMFK